MTHDLLVCNLHALKFDVTALNLIFDYLTGKKQRVKINFTFSSYEDLFQGTPHRSVLERILFNLFLCDLYLFVDELILRSYAVDNTPSVCSENVSVILEKLGDVRNLFFEWFSSTCYRQMVTNAIPS